MSDVVIYPGTNAFSIEISTAVLSANNMEIGFISIEPPDPTNDPNLWAWWRSDTGTVTDINNVFITGSFCWMDQSGNGHHLLCNPVKLVLPTDPRFSGSYGNPPVLRPSDRDYNNRPSVLFSPTGFPTYRTINLYTLSSSLPQPVSIYILSRMTGANLYDTGLFSGLESGSHVYVYGGFHAPALALSYFMYAGYPPGLFPPPEGPFVDEFQISAIYTFIFDDSSSFTQVNNGIFGMSSNSGRVGTNPLNGIWIGGPSGSVAEPTWGPSGVGGGDGSIAAMIISTGHNDLATRNAHIAWLKWYGGLVF